MEEVENYHLDTLKIVIPRVNELAGQKELRHQERVQKETKEAANHQATVHEVAKRLRFD